MLDNKLPLILIIELGSQYTLLIARTLRELGYRSAVLGPKQAAEFVKQNPVQAVILSGGFSSVYEPNAPQPPAEVLSLTTADGHPVPVLGICYGMQWMASKLRGEVANIQERREYGPATLFPDTGHPLFAGTPASQSVWASHGDSVMVLPKDFSAIASNGGTGIAAMANQSHTLLGVQFHPEVSHTPNGALMLRNFVCEIAHCEPDWFPSSIESAIREGISASVRGRRAILGYSGGVDSTTVAALAAQLGDNLLGVLIDAGHLREGEIKEVQAHAQAANIKLECVPAHRRFRELIGDELAAAEKRKRFKAGYRETLLAWARKFGADVIIQGTLAPDMIESGATGGAQIKEHHNVGIQWDSLEPIQPIDAMFKYEVRALAEAIGLPPSVCNRQPFPGPGLFIRVIGIPANEHNLIITRWADAQTRIVTENHHIYDKLSQLVVGYGQPLTVGVKGDSRAYLPSALVRAVKTADFMTARGYYFPKKVAREVNRVLTSHEAIGRALFDPTHKPPGTTEFQ